MIRMDIVLVAFTVAKLLSQPLTITTRRSSAVYHIKLCEPAVSLVEKPHWKLPTIPLRVTYGRNRATFADCVGWSAELNRSRRWSKTRRLSIGPFHRDAGRIGRAVNDSCSLFLSNSST